MPSQKQHPSIGRTRSFEHQLNLPPVTARPRPCGDAVGHAAVRRSTSGSHGFFATVNGRRRTVDREAAPEPRIRGPTVPHAPRAPGPSPRVPQASPPAEEQPTARGSPRQPLPEEAAPLPGVSGHRIESTPRSLPVDGVVAHICRTAAAAAKMEQAALELLARARQGRRRATRAAVTLLPGPALSRAHRDRLAAIVAPHVALLQRWLRGRSASVECAARAALLPDRSSPSEGAEARRVASVEIAGLSVVSSRGSQASSSSASVASRNRPSTVLNGAVVRRMLEIFDTMYDADAMTLQDFDAGSLAGSQGPGSRAASLSSGNTSLSP